MGWMIFLLDVTSVCSNACEAKACRHIRQLWQAELKINGDSSNEFWVADVAGVHGISRTLARADGAALHPVPVAGYLFVAIPEVQIGANLYERYDTGHGTHPFRFAFCAIPARYGQARLTLIVCEDGNVWAKDTRGRPVERFPLNPAAAGWRRID
jgi:hypothetical protein